jgi:hypothetical protein
MVATTRETINLMPDGPSKHVKLVRCEYLEDKSKQEAQAKITLLSIISFFGAIETSDLP